MHQESFSQARNTLAWTESWCHLSFLPPSSHEQQKKALLASVLALPRSRRHSHPEMFEMLSLHRSTPAVMTCHKACAHQGTATFSHPPHLRCIKAQGCAPWVASSLMGHHAMWEWSPGCLPLESSSSDFLPSLSLSLFPYHLSLPAPSPSCGHLSC